MKIEMGVGNISELLVVDLGKDSIVDDELIISENLIEFKYVSVQVDWSGFTDLTGKLTPFQKNDIVMEKSPIPALEIALSTQSGTEIIEYNEFLGIVYGLTSTIVDTTGIIKFKVVLKP